MSQMQHSAGPRAQGMPAAGPKSDVEGETSDVMTYASTVVIVAVLVGVVALVMVVWFLAP